MILQGRIQYDFCVSSMQQTCILSKKALVVTNDKMLLLGIRHTCFLRAAFSCTAMAAGNYDRSPARIYLLPAQDINIF